MPKSGKTIPFFTDQNVPDSVGAAIIAAGHSLVRLRDAMEVDTPDPVIFVACSQSGHVLVTHDSDFKDLSKRLKITKRQYRNNLHRIQLQCLEPESAQRIQEAMSLIEFEWNRLADGDRMTIEIKSQSIKVLR